MTKKPTAEKPLSKWTWTIILHDERVVVLTTGELNALKKMYRENRKGGPLYRPSGVRYDTLANLVSKGVLMRVNGVHYFTDGVLPPA